MTDGAVEAVYGPPLYPAILRKPFTWAVPLFGFAPLLLIAVAKSLEQMLVCLMIYFALAWTAFFFVCFAHRGASLKLGLGVAAFTIFVGVPVGTLLTRIPPLSFTYAMTSEQVGLRRLVGFICADGLNEELLKALPVWLLAFGLRRIHRPSDGLFYGALSGLGFAMFEGYNAIALAPDSREMATQMLVRTTALPFLHATFTALDGYFIALAVQSTSRRAAICVLGLAVASVMHGVYDFAPGIARFFIAVLVYLSCHVIKS
jgi:RsiW-degrading membrane proteinase PrsW (M82 family)